MYFRKSSGLTIAELVVLIAIIVLLSWVIFEGTKNTRAKARDTERVNNIKYLKKVLQNYFNENRSYPVALDHNFLGADYIKIIPKDPGTGKDYFYAVVSLGKTRRCVDYHLGANLEITELDSDIFKTDDDLAPQSNTCPGSAPDFDGKDPIYDIKQ
ncbi:MAG: hypothetical protein AAB488_01860 [Patescibacteria group bacterium]